MKKILGYLGLGAVVLTVSGCTQTGGYYATPSMNGGYNPAMQAQPPVSGYQAPQHAMPQQMPQVQNQQTDKLVSEVNVMRERIRRVERAMVRLDRRMQLIERNELSRMSGSSMEGAATPAPQGMFQPMSYGKQQAASLKAVPTPRAHQQQQNARFQPVAYGTQPQAVTSSLGVAPKTAPMMAPQQKSAFTGMPSLADKTATEKEHSVSTWIINYENGKVWPGRDQLSSSRDVIESLKDGEPVALFARGAKPSSRAFRERVRAISKYLSKVTDIDNLPIASMSAKHLDGDTIELLATK